MITVTYGCDCERYFPIEQLYYCHTCQKLNCTYCVTQEIDTYYCPNCLENITSSEATSYKNSCKKCFECPMCFSVLSYVSFDPPNADPRASPSPTLQPIKTILSCGFCRWSTQDIPELKVETPPQLITRNLELEKEDPVYKDITKLIDTLQKEEKEKVKQQRQQTRMRRTSFHARTPMKPVTSAQDIDKNLQKKKEANNTENNNNKDIVRIPGNDDTSNLEKSLDISRITSLNQRFFNMSVQPTTSSHLMAKRKLLLTRRSKHCRRCDKLLVKPDLSPVKIEFKRQHVALSYVPKITLAKLPPLSLNEASIVVLKIVNPVRSYMDLSLSDPDENNNTTNQQSTVEILLPSHTTFIAPKDQDEDEDANYKLMKEKDDPKVIKERKMNTVFINLPIKPLKSSEVKFSLLISGKYKSSAAGELAFSFVVKFDLGTINSWAKQLVPPVVISCTTLPKPTLTSY